MYYIGYSVAFGLALGFGGSLLEPVTIPFLGITFASLLVAVLVTLNKLVVFRKYSVTAMYAVTSIVAIFTTYLGPPSIIKPVFIIAGFSFDAATFFRTKNLKFWNLVLGHLAITITGFFFFWVNVAFVAPGTASAVGWALLAASPVHFLASVIIAYLLFEAIPPSDPPQVVSEIRDQVK